MSDFIVIVIHDRQYCPLLFEDGGQKYIPAESVYAALEVKQDLNKGHIEYAAAKGESVRRLRRTNVDIVHAGGVHEPRPLFDIITGITRARQRVEPVPGRVLCCGGPRNNRSGFTHQPRLLPSPRGVRGRMGRRVTADYVERTRCVPHVLPHGPVHPAPESRHRPSDRSQRIRTVTPRIAQRSALLRCSSAPLFLGALELEAGGRELAF